MNGRELTLAAVHGTPHPRVPVAQHNFPFCLRHCGIAMDDYRRNPLLAAKVLATTAFDFGYDCIIVDFDTCTLAEAMGSQLDFPEHEPARVRDYRLKQLEEVRDLQIPDPHRDGRMPLWLETTRELRALVGDEKAIMARADQGPFGLLFQLREPQEMMMDLLDEDSEALLRIGLDRCVEAGVRFARAQIEAGADLTSIGDSASGESLISPELYESFAQPYQKRYKEMLGDGLLSLHICGKTNNIIEGMVATGCEVLEVDHFNDIERTVRAAADRTSIWGNLDPSSVLCLGSREMVLAESRKVLEAVMPLTWRFVLCPGCLVNANCPAENVRAMSEAAAEYGGYDVPPNKTRT